MSGIKIHTDDPINPAKASGITPQTAHSSGGNPSQPGQVITASPYTYAPAQPGAAAPTPTSTVPQSSNYGPPAPQPGVAPVPPPPTITARTSVPPPPKAGQKPLPAEHYAPVRSTPAEPQPYPPTSQSLVVDQPPRALPPGSTTSTSIQASFNSSSQPSGIPSSTDMQRRGSLEHPPGYVQNPFASDVTPHQRFTAEQQRENRSDELILPALGYVDNSKGAKLGSEDEQSLWGTTKKWVKERGQQASELEEKIWNKFGTDK